MIAKRVIVKFLILIFQNIYEKTPSKKSFEKNIIENFSVYLSPVFKAPDFIFKSDKIIKYTIIYDLIPTILQDYYPKKINALWYINLLNSLNENDYYFAISEKTRQDFINYNEKLIPDKIITTLLAANENFFRCENKEKNITTKNMVIKTPNDKNLLGDINQEFIHGKNYNQKEPNCLIRFCNDYNIYS